MTTSIEIFAIGIILASILGIIFRKLNQPIIISYIITGIIVGVVFSNQTSINNQIKTISELGLVFLLFLIGLEVHIEKLKEVIKVSTFITVLNALATIIGSFLIINALGFSRSISIFLAISTGFSSTAVVIKLLSDKDESTTLPGKLNISLLLIQDFLVIIVIALVSMGLKNPSLSSINTKITGNIIKTSFKPILYLITGAILIYFLPKMIEKISSNTHTYFMFGITWMFTLVTISSKIGISPEIGAFIAGISLAQIPYTRELTERVRPLTDLFIAIFFIKIGLGFTTEMLRNNIFKALILGFLIIFIKFFSHFLASIKFFSFKTSLKSSLNVSQMSEFSLVIGALGLSNNYINMQAFGLLSLTTLFTMIASSYFITYNEKIFQILAKKLNIKDKETKRETIKLEEHAIIVGYDELTKQILPALNKKFEKVLIIDNEPETVRKLKNSTNEYIYGDFKHSEIRNSANITKAKIIISTVKDPQLNKRILEETNDETTKITRAESMQNAAEFYEMGAHYVIQKNVLSGEKIKEYLKLYLEDRKLFFEEIQNDIERIKWGEKDD